ncbi:MAG: hypothetical protein HFJ20_03610 [Clostridia bacterium]|nr:hypothetical protein [Clostridia bacterium]
MTVIVTDGELTEQRKQKAYKYKGLFKLINNICNLIEELEEIDDSRTTQNIEQIQINTAKEINNILTNRI